MSAILGLYWNFHISTKSHLSGWSELDCFCPLWHLGIDSSAYSSLAVVFPQYLFLIALLEFHLTHEQFSILPKTQVLLYLPISSTETSSTFIFQQPLLPWILNLYLHGKTSQFCSIPHLCTVIWRKSPARQDNCRSYFVWLLLSLI